jgi:hypothetical protein
MRIRAIENGFTFFRVNQFGYSGTYTSSGNKIFGYNFFNVKNEDIVNCDLKNHVVTHCYKPHIFYSDIPIKKKNFTLYPYITDLLDYICILIAIIGCFILIVDIVIYFVVLILKLTKKFTKQKNKFIEIKN